jgi:hypothetical protein
MLLRSLPVSLCHTNCTKCGLAVEFQLFESGAGGDFGTYFGRITQSIYRLDMGQVHYLAKSETELLIPAIEREQGAENLLRVPEQLNCKYCGTPVATQNCLVDGEANISAYAL